MEVSIDESGICPSLAFCPATFKEMHRIEVLSEDFCKKETHTHTEENPKPLDPISILEDVLAHVVFCIWSQTLNLKP